jgi:hypothetical protein
MHCSTTEEEVGGEADIPVVAPECLLADLSIEAHLHELLDLVLLGHLLREILCPGPRRVFKHLAIVLVHACNLCILGVIYITTREFE